MFRSGALSFAVILTMAAAPARAAELSVQIVNPDGHALVRVLLDRKPIYEGTPEPAIPGEPTMLPVTAGTVELSPSTTRRQIVTEVPSAHISARLEWDPDTIAGRWLVIHYIPARPGQPPAILYRLQNTPFKLK